MRTKIDQLFDKIATVWLVCIVLGVIGFLAYGIVEVVIATGWWGFLLIPVFVTVWALIRIVTYVTEATW